MTVWMDWYKMDLVKYTYMGIRTRDHGEVSIGERQGLWYVKAKAGGILCMDNEPEMVALWLNSQSALFV